MGIVKVSEEMHEALRRTSGALSRSVNGQAEHWLRVGMLAELHPELSYGDICKLLIQIEERGFPDPSKIAKRAGNANAVATGMRRAA